MRGLGTRLMRHILPSGVQVLEDYVSCGLFPPSLVPPSPRD